MLRSFVVLAGVAIALVGCRKSLDEEIDAPANQRACMPSTSMACMDAVNHSDLAWIEKNIFETSCTFSGCHNGAATPAGTMNLLSTTPPPPNSPNPGGSHDNIVNIDSRLQAAAKIVVPGNPKASYLMMMVQQFKPDEMTPPVEAPLQPPNGPGLMPQNSPTAICCQKLDALERWITAGAAM
jgi:hypothetical protein